MERKLAAIFSLDMVGYSRLVEEDERETLTRHAVLETDLVRPAIARHRGRVIKGTGDGVLAEFASAVDAVECAAEIQQRMAGLEMDRSPANRIRFRIGINVGDVVVRDGDLFGDGVNVAARVESMADPGGIMLSESAYQQVEGKVDVGFTDAGLRTAKNLVRPVHVYRVELEPGKPRSGRRRSFLQELLRRRVPQFLGVYLLSGWALLEFVDWTVRQYGLTPAISSSLVTLLAIMLPSVFWLAWRHGARGPDGWARSEVLTIGLNVFLAVTGAVFVGRSPPSERVPARHPRTTIAVLPFQNLSADGSNAYFAGGLHDELLTQLAKVGSLRPISRTSVMRYAGSTQPVQQIAEELAVGTIVEGSVQVVGDLLRVHVQLIDAVADEPLWAERYDGNLNDAFGIQSDIAHRVVAAVGGTLTGQELETIDAVPTENPEAYRLYLQGKEYRNRSGTRQDLEIALDLWERAVALDPEFALAYAELSRIHGIMYWYAYDPSPERRAAQRRMAEVAIQLDPQLPEAREAMIYVHYYGELDYSRALAEALVVLERLPGSARLWYTAGYLYRRLGQWEEALAAYEKAAALDPMNVGQLTVLGGDTFKFLHRWEEAVRVYDRVLELTPDRQGTLLRRAWTYLLWRGDLDTLRSLLGEASGTFGDRGSVDRWRARLGLWDRNPGAVLATLPEPSQVIFEARMAWEPGMLYAGWAHRLEGDESATASAFAGALAHADSVLRERPDDWRAVASRGFALAGLGRGAEAVRMSEQLTESPVYADQFTRPFLDELRAMIYAQLGSVDDALPMIQELIEGPSWTSLALIRVDPRYDPIREDARFRKLLERYASIDAPQSTDPVVSR